MHNTFWLSRRARRIENVEGMLGLERLSRAIVRSLRHQLMPPVIAAFGCVDRRSSALVDDNMLYRRTRLECFFDGRKKFDFSATAIRSILRDHGDRVGIMNAIDQRV